MISSIPKGFNESLNLFRERPGEKATAGGVRRAYAKKGPDGDRPNPCRHWSRLPDSNRRPHPYHGCALPTELSRRCEALQSLALPSLTPCRNPSMTPSVSISGRLDAVAPMTRNVNLRGGSCSLHNPTNELFLQQGRGLATKREPQLRESEDVVARVIVVLSQRMP